MTAQLARWADEHPARLASIAQRAGRVLSRYVVPTALLDEADDAIWIITDDLADSDSTTTILWPSDY